MKMALFQSILSNSTSTLQSLVVETHSLATSILQSWEGTVSANNAFANQNHIFTVLKSFTLSGVSFDATFIKSLQRAIDFMGLRELTLGHLLDDKHLFFLELASVTRSPQNTATGITLRNICLELLNDSYRETLEQAQTNFEATCRFIS
jgi:hypothetical protein